MANGTKAPPQTKAIVPALIPRSIDELTALAKIVFSAGPPTGHGRFESVAMAIAFGMEIGLLPVQSIASVMVLDGKPSLYGDAALGLLLASPLCESMEHGTVGHGDEHHGWIQTKRRGEDAYRKTTFSVADAKQAGLWRLDQQLPSDPKEAAKKKKAAWYAYADRMLVWKAVSHHMKDWWADVLRGLTIYEDVMAEIEVREVREVRNESPAQSQAIEDRTVVVESRTEPVAADPNAPIRENQLAKLAELKPVYLTLRNVGSTDPAAQADEWKRLLAHWSVESARTLTAGQADELIAKIVEARDACDPTVRGLFLQAGSDSANAA